MNGLAEIVGYSTMAGLTAWVVSKAWEKWRRRTRGGAPPVPVRDRAAQEAGERTARLMRDVLGIEAIAIDPSPHEGMVFTAIQGFELIARLHLTQQCPRCHRYGWHSHAIRAKADLHIALRELTVARCSGCGCFYATEGK